MEGQREPKPKGKQSEKKKSLVRQTYVDANGVIRTTLRRRDAIPDSGLMLMDDHGGKTALSSAPLWWAELPRPKGLSKTVWEGFKEAHHKANAFLSPSDTNLNESAQTIP